MIQDGISDTLYEKKKTVLHDIESQSRFSNLPNEKKILLMKNYVLHLFHIFCHVIVLSVFV